MPRPIQSCAKNIDYCSEADRTIHGALSENHRKHGGTGASKSVTPYGDTRMEVKRREDGAVGGAKSVNFTNSPSTGRARPASIRSTRCSATP